MSDATRTRSSTSERAFLAWRAIVVVAALLLSFVSWRLFERMERERGEILAYVRRSPTASLQPEIERSVLNESDLVKARIQAAWAMVEQQLDPRWIAFLPEEQRSEAVSASVGLLEETLRLTSEALVQRPAMAEAALVHGVATYLQILRQDTQGLATRIDEWERPLMGAYRHASTRAEASRYLALAYFDVWLSLSSAKKEEILPVFKNAFEDLETFEHLIQPWLRMVHDQETALSVVPDHPDQWSWLMKFFQERHDWRNFVNARVRWRHAFVATTHERLDEASARSSGGDLVRGRHRYELLMSSLKPRGFQLPLLERILSEAPSGSLTSANAEILGAWLDWTLDLGYIGHRPLPPDLLTRLVRNSGRIDQSKLALAQVLAGNGLAARQIEFRSVDGWTREWGRYLVLNSLDLIARGNAPAAEDALLRVATEWQESVPYWQAKAALATENEDPALGELASRKLQTLAASRWESSRWVTESSREWSLVLLPERSEESLVLSIGRAPEQGAVIELEWDGALIDTFVIGPRTEIRVPIEVTAELHRLDFRQITSRGSVVPGAVRLDGG